MWNGAGPDRAVEKELGKLVSAQTLTGFEFRVGIIFFSYCNSRKFYKFLKAFHRNQTHFSFLRKANLFVSLGKNF